MRASLARALLFILWYCLVQSAWAWSDSGHQTAALIAWKQLSPDERARLVVMLEDHPFWEEDFRQPMAEALGTQPTVEHREQWLLAQAATWPDHIRGPRGASTNPYQQWHLPTWHYINYPIFTSKAAEQAMAPQMAQPNTQWLPGWSSIVESRMNAVQAVRKMTHQISDPRTTPPMRAAMLCWLLHLVGDLHQPAHTVSLFDPMILPKGDRGGNVIMVQGLRDSSLHAYWDGLLGRSTSSLAATRTRVHRLGLDNSLLRQGERAALNLDPDVWTQESYQIAQRYVYPPELRSAVAQARPDSARPGRRGATLVVRLAPGELERYQANAQTMADQQIMRAGYRLAASLRAVLSALATH